jgi:hypothetical protein
MEIPAGWRYRPATEDWPPHTYPQPGATYTDNFEPSGGFPAIDVSTQVLPAGQTRREFLADLDSGNADFGCTVEETEEITVDGETGRLQRQLCAGGTENIWEVTVFDGDRVYLIYWIGRASARADDEPVFRELMETFRFAAE